jgi:hypothetical protein
VFIPGYDHVCSSLQSRFQDAIILGIGTNHSESALREN